MRTFRAPGKLVLMGEYAVLDGAPSLVAAVNAGVSCAWEASAERRIITPGPDTFARAALDHAGVTTGTWTFGNYNAPPTDTKPGLGGSAGATVAALLAARTVAGEPTEQLFADAFRVHHDVQGSGSGVDVAAAVAGGVIRYKMGQPPVPVSPIELVVVWSGQSAKTGPRVQQYQAWSDRAAFVAETTRLVSAFADDPIAATRAARRLLEDMASQAGISYTTPALTAIADLAEAHGGAAKPSGAGGGDCAVAVFADALSAVEYRHALTGAGYRTLDLALSTGAHELP